MGFPRQVYLSGKIPSPGDLPDPSIESGPNALQVDSLTTKPPTATPKSRQLCPTLCDPIPGILQARTLECVAISFSNA